MTEQAVGVSLSLTFNRTSMESKLGWAVGAGGQCSLLIEPVWNRNEQATCHRDHRPQTFNRTSMESKRVFEIHLPCQYLSFNRTSMESKL